MNIESKEQWEQAFFKACEKGHIEDVRHLCQKQYLDLEWADIHCFNESGFRVACLNGHLDVIRYLLTSKELIEAGHTFANLHAENEYGFRFACENGHLDIVKYFLTSPELKEAGHSFADVHAWNSGGLSLTFLKKNWDIARWLIMDYKMEKTPKIQEMTKHYPQAEEYFRVREELQDIQKTLNTKKHENLNEKCDLVDIKDQRAAKKVKKL